MSSSPPGQGWRPAHWAKAVRAASQNPVFISAASNLGLICIWYFLSTLLGIYNKTILGKEHGLKDKGAFPAPLLMSGVQFAIQYLLAKIVFSLGLVERTKDVVVERAAYWKLVVPNGVMTGLDIGFSNTSLVYITMSFYTMCKSTVPIFLLTCAFIWRIEKPSWELAGVVTVICSGLVLLVAGESRFSLPGFLLVMTASAMSGVRFTLTQVSLHGHENAVAMGGPLEVLELLTPIMSLTSLGLSLGWEQLWHVLPLSPYTSTPEQCLVTLVIIGVGAMMAFCMVWTEYKVIKETSALTFMIAGTCKEVLTVIVAVLVFEDRFGVINGIGLVIVILGVVLFNVHKWRKMQTDRELQQAKMDGGRDEELVPLVVAASGAQQPSAAGLSHAGHDKDSHASANGTANGSSSTGHSSGGSSNPLDSAHVLVIKPGIVKSPRSGRHHKADAGFSEKEPLLPGP